MSEHQASLRGGRAGRRPVTTKAELERIGLALFRGHGFDATTVEDVAAAGGIARRTFFRYYASKNDLVWGDFDTSLERLRSRLRSTDHRQPLLDALKESILAFNALDPAQEPTHRLRMELILRVPALQAHSTLRYTAWREVVADYAAGRLRLDAQELLPQLIAHSCLGAALTAYEQWLGSPDKVLPELLDQALSALDGGWTQATG